MHDPATHPGRAARTSAASCALLLACLLGAGLAAGCRKAPEPEKTPDPMSLEEALDAIVAATLDDVSAGGTEEDEWAPPARPLPSPEDARTNLVARFTLRLRDNAAEMAELTARREAALEAARETNAVFAAASAEAKAARERYEALVRADPAITAIEEEMARLRRERGALLRQREKFEKTPLPTTVSK
ncbi:MAG: hypothetical protein ACOX5G_11465 [Kiritimatiellia bacterium]|jgi:hypothetical protein